MAAPNYGRAGRNLKAATAVGVGLLALVVATLFVQPLLYAALVVAFAVLAVRELVAALRPQLPRELLWMLQLYAVFTPLVAYWHGPIWLLVFTGLLIIETFAGRLFGPQEGYLADVTTSIFVFLYAPFLASFSVLLAAQSQGAWKVLGIVLLTTGTDLGGYLAGILFGKHPMAPRISPKKSWEGLAGSLVLTSLVGIGLWLWVFKAPIWRGALVGLVLVCTAVIGDLAESMIKRDLGIKDMGNTLPGHGGIMDRLDALLVNAFVGWALFAWLLGT